METTDQRRLVRPRDRRRIAGVAEGLGRHLDIDPVILRIAFVAGTIVGGFGLVAYAVAWVAIPVGRAEAGTVATAAQPSRWMTFTLIVLATLVFAVGGSVAAASALDVPLRGGIGDRSWTPSGDVRDTYRLAVGDAELDLTRLEDHVVDIVVTVGVGSLKVVVPANAWLDIDASVGVGKVDAIGTFDEGVAAARHVTTHGNPSGRVIQLELHTGIGDIEVVRAA